MTYNLLAHEKSSGGEKDQWYAFEGAPEKQHLSFYYRAPKIVQEITESGASIIGL